MKQFILGIAIFFISMLFTIFHQDYNLHQEHLFNLKFITAETAAAGAQFIELEEYKEGGLVFNQEEGKKACEYIIQKQLSLDEDMNPSIDSYWQGQIKCTIEFFDDSNTTFPFLYSRDNGNFTLTITEPTVVVVLNAGKPRYRLYNNTSDVIRIAAHSWKGRN